MRAMLDAVFELQEMLQSSCLGAEDRAEAAETIHVLMRERAQIALFEPMMSAEAGTVWSAYDEGPTAPIREWAPSDRERFERFILMEGERLQVWGPLALMASVASGGGAAKIIAAHGGGWLLTQAAAGAVGGVAYEGVYVGGMEGRLASAQEFATAALAGAVLGPILSKVGGTVGRVVRRAFGRRVVQPTAAPACEQGGVL